MKVEYERRDDGLYCGTVSQVAEPHAFIMITRRQLVETICQCIKTNNPKRVAIHIDGAEKPLYLHGLTTKSIVEGKRTAEDFIIGSDLIDEEK